ncbi:MAG: hypothetical protein KatS3mg077_1593 [Candidatus Binatia bacterium]|nr:MAG: hypothetical protein KatS3mg077_1593 [Candidatus Binatia bacterium]
MVAWRPIGGWGSFARAHLRKLRKVVLAAGGVAVWLAALAPQKAAATPACTEILRNFSASVSGETSGESGDAGSCGGTEAPELSLTFTAPRAGSYTFDTFGSAFDTVLYVRSEDGTELGCNDDVQLGVHAWSRVRVTLGAEQTVRVIVDGFGSQSGAFVLRIHAECPLPFRADARDLGSASTWVTGASRGTNGGHYPGRQRGGARRVCFERRGGAVYADDYGHADGFAHGDGDAVPHGKPERHELAHVHALPCAYGQPLSHGEPDAVAHPHGQSDADAERHGASECNRYEVGHRHTISVGNSVADAHGDAFGLPVAFSALDNLPRRADCPPRASQRVAD